MNDQATIDDGAGSMMSMGGASGDQMRIVGRFTAIHRNAAGDVLWEDEFPNLVTTMGKNYLLDTGLAGSGFTVVGPFMGLISSVSYTAIAAADTMASHTGWTEAGITNAPTYSGGRKTAVWSAASAGTKALSAGLLFTFTGAGTVKGVFLALSTGAVATVDSTLGSLYSAGLFTGGDRIVASADTLTCSYSATLT